MSRRSNDYTRCPACGRRTVLLKLGREDAYVCTWGGRARLTSPCGWSTYADPEHWDTTGQADLDAWRALNPHAE